jgi:hypothetical protein
MMFLALALLPTAPAMAQVVIYRCTDANGNLTVQNDTPCPAGSRQHKQVIEDVPTAPHAPPPAAAMSMPSPAELPAALDASTMPEVLPDTPLAPLVSPDDAPADVPRLLDSGTPAAERTDVASAEESSAPQPPPPLKVCTTWDQESYFTGSEEPMQRCAPLRTIGVGGNDGIGAGAACEMLTDTCQPVPETVLCDAWLRHLRNEQGKLVFARSDDPDATKAEVERAEAVLKDSTCNTP